MTQPQAHPAAHPPSDIPGHGSVFMVLSCEHVLEVLDDNSTTFRSEHKFLVQALLPSRFFERSYLWSGTDHTDAPEVSCPTDLWGHPLNRVHGPVIREGPARIVLVDLGRQLPVGETATVCISHELRDFGATFQPRLGVRGRPGLKSAVLSVILPSRLAGKVTYRELMRDTEFDQHIEPVLGIALSGSRVEFRKEIAMSHASINRTYRLCWGDLA